MPRVSLRRGLSDDQAQRAAQILLQKGFREMKTQMRCPQSAPAEEVRPRARGARAIGPTSSYVRHHQRWRPSRRSDRQPRREEGIGLFWLEDVPPSTTSRLARVTAALKTPIAGGEYVWGIVPFRHMIEARSVDIVMVDLARVGGVTQWMKVAGMAEAFNLPIVSHVMPEILLHMVAACPNGLTVEYMPWMLALYEETPEIKDGQLVLPQKPGLGLSLTEGDQVVSANRHPERSGPEGRAVEGPLLTMHRQKRSLPRLASRGSGRDDGEGPCVCGSKSVKCRKMGRFRHVGLLWRLAVRLDTASPPQKISRGDAAA